ncbi:MAG: PQQ-dependent sugar dehydrogenase [Acidobacteria bacterium]|nr:PQQ-dependent sugar dehydrogenase [Acidobacteriota bacterium]
MPSASFAGVLALMLAVQAAADSRACSPSAPGSPTPTASSGNVLTTTDGVRFTAETMATNLEVPWAMAFAPDGRLFVTERPGRVRILNLTAGSSEVALTLDDVYAEGEAGLLGLALDPEFAESRLVYLYYSARLSPTGRVNRVVRYREVASRLAERVVLLDNIPAGQIHDGGRLRFGPDGLLYVTAGDAASSGLAQDLGSLAGKILRIARDGSTPRDNLSGSPIYSYGHRNPQGLDWHPSTGDLWADEHGNIGNDEINVIEAGANYGWPRIEAGQTMAGMRTPVTFFNPAIAPSGASFYRGQRFPQFANNLFVGTLRGTHLLRITVDAAAKSVVAQERLLVDTFGRLRDVLSGPDGYLYFCTNNRDGRGSPIATDDRVVRLVPAP